MARQFRQQSIFRFMIKSGGELRAKDIAEKFGMRRRTVSQILRYMADKGAVSLVGGSTHKAKWAVKNPNMDLSPLAGMHPNSLANLRNVQKTNVGRIRDKRRTDWPAATELEKLWRPVVNISEIELSE